MSFYFQDYQKNKKYNYYQDFLKQNQLFLQFISNIFMKIQLFKFWNLKLQMQIFEQRLLLFYKFHQLSGSYLAKCLYFFQKILIYRLNKLRMLRLQGTKYIFLSWYHNIYFILLLQVSNNSVLNSQQYQVKESIFLKLS